MGGEKRRGGRESIGDEGKGEDEGGRRRTEGEEEGRGTEAGFFFFFCQTPVSDSRRQQYPARHSISRNSFGPTRRHNSLISKKYFLIGRSRINRFDAAEC